MRIAGESRDVVVGLVALGWSSVHLLFYFVLLIGWAFPGGMWSGQWGLSPSASTIGRRSGPQKTGDVVDRMANAVAHFGDVLGAGLVAVWG